MTTSNFIVKNTSGSVAFNAAERLKIVDLFANQGWFIGSNELADPMNIKPAAITAKGDEWHWRNWVINRVGKDGNQILWQLTRLESASDSAIELT